MNVWVFCAYLKIWTTPWGE